MRPIHFATRNRGKFFSVSDSLSKQGIETIQVPIEMPEPRSDDLKEIAGEKVLFAYGKVGKPCISLDSGFYVDSLNGFPRAFVNFVLETIGINGILRLVEGKQRECEFRNCLAYFDGEVNKPLFFESRVFGTLAEAPRGELQPNAWSDLFLIFTPVDSSKTLAEMTLKEYAEWKRLREADLFVTKFAEWFLENR
ncbi:hypothetical protein HY991_03150 [Candidatus Micrarchaeota archaeon]|nr:hypothetical protein [Candidatus Micrarchaeota archaeon]